MMADLHAITVPHEPKELLASTRNTAALYLACGIDPDRAAIFVQSHVTAHAELAWMLQCYTPIGWLRKMIQYKTKSEKQVRLRAPISVRVPQREQNQANLMHVGVQCNCRCVRFVYLTSKGVMAVY